MTILKGAEEVEEDLNNGINFLRSFKNCAMVAENHEVIIDLETLKMLYKLLKECKQAIIT